MLVGKWLPIICYKHDGKIHRSWNRTLVILDNDDFLVVGNDNAMVYEADGRNWKVKEPAITIFAKKSWYNVIAMIRDEGIKYYVNIASPFTISNNCICYIDYDLDVSLKPNQPLKVLDEHEYAMHYKSMGYDKKIDYILKNALYEVLELIDSHTFPFIDEKIHQLYDEFVNIKKEA